MQAQERFAALSAQPMISVANNSKTLAGAWSSVQEVFNQREMLGLMVRRDIKSRYKDSALGFMWALVRPLTQLAIYYLVIGRVLGAARGIPDFAIYVFTGLTAFGLISEIISSATGSIVGNGGLIKKIYLPREIFPLASVGSALFNLMIQLGVLLLACLALQSFPSSIEILYFFPSLLVLVVYGTAFGILLSAVNVYLRDAQYLVEVVMLILMWASPIVYLWSMVRDRVGPGLLLELYTDNPLTLAVLGFQRAFWTGGHEGTDYPGMLLLRLAVALIVGLVLLVLFQRVFARLQGNFAQEL